MLSFLKDLLVPESLSKQVDQAETTIGTYGHDPWGFSPEAMKIPLSVAKWLYDHYFRVQAYGLEHVPARGRLLIVANHSGQLPMDGALVGVALATNPHGPRLARAMIERFFPTVPYVGNLLNQCGAVIGDPINCAKLLEKDEAIIVFPEGVRGSGKPYKHRYQLQRFGTGFMHLAMKYHCPVVPAGVVGCEETMPSLGSIDPLARLLGLPYVPICLPCVLPAKVVLNFGKPRYYEDDVETEGEVAARVDTVKDEIRHLVNIGLKQRGGVFV